MPRTFDVRNAQVRDLVLQEATRIIRDGGLVVMPTDTVYGVAADAFSGPAVAGLLAAKGRGRDMPPPVLVAGRDTMLALTDSASPELLAIVEEFWPGPLTVICRAQPMLDWDLGDTHGTVAVRMPDDPDALALLEQTGPLAVSSANTSGDPAAQTVEEAEQMLGDSVALILDGGPRTGGAASTIVDMTAEPPRVVRSGPIGVDALRAHIPSLLGIGETASADPAGESALAETDADS